MRRLVSLALLILATGASAAPAKAPAISAPLDVFSGTSPVQGAAAVPRQDAQDGKDAPAAPAPEQAGTRAKPYDYDINLNSDVFGAQLFTGVFSRQNAGQFNPDYLIASGDRVQVRMWGGFTYDAVLVVDPQGNLFLPQIGPVNVRGTRNEDLQALVERAGRRVFRNNVFTYASLAAAQPVRVFVGGNVSRPGLYNGTSMDSLLHYLDQAGGIDLQRGSFLSIQVKRGEIVRANVNLYDFLLDGRVPLVQLADGDVIFIGPRGNTTLVTGAADNAKRFEFKSAQISLAELSHLAKPKAQATHVRIVRNTGAVRNVDYFALADATNIMVGNGDEVEFTADKKLGTITVRVEGEHQSAQEYVLPYGARFGQLIEKISFSERSDVDAIQLFRSTVRARQKNMLMTSLKSLESATLSARSGTSDEAQLRKEEAALVLQWVERAKKIEPSGQVLIAQASSRNELLLENGDVIKVPARDGLVLVSGEVLFPNTIAFDRSLSLEEYITRAGGYTQNADNSRIVIAHRDGSYSTGTSTALRPGDEVLVLPKVDVKSRQIWKELTQILYQLAFSARIVLAL